mmetsp:Transcript_1980/g.5886  ORF Transcript_1980/g.5886 Transcript_1980/m.5886 type:complete len:218 (-) Transcript_1980:2042-2695(-)
MRLLRSRSRLPRSRLPRSRRRHCPSTCLSHRCSRNSSSSSRRSHSISPRPRPTHHHSRWPCSTRRRSRCRRSTPRRPRPLPRLSRSTSSRCHLCRSLPHPSSRARSSRPRPSRSTALHLWHHTTCNLRRSRRRPRSMHHSRRCLREQRRRLRACGVAPSLTCSGPCPQARLEGVRGAAVAVAAVGRLRRGMCRWSGSSTRWPPWASPAMRCEARWWS